MLLRGDGFCNFFVKKRENVLQFLGFWPTFRAFCSLLFSYFNNLFLFLLLLIF